MTDKRQRLYWSSTFFDRLDRQKLAQLAAEAGFPFDEDELAGMTRSDLIDLLVDVTSEAESDAGEAHGDYPLRRPVRTTVPPWLPSPTGRVHLRWVDDWRRGLRQLLDGDDGLDVPRSAEPGDVVVTVLACVPPLVAAVELIEKAGAASGVDRVLIAQPVPWDSLWSAGEPKPLSRRARLSREAGERTLDALRHQLEQPEPWFVNAGDCTRYHTYPSIIDAIAFLQVDHPDRTGLHSWCASCGRTDDVGFHFERPLHDNVQLEIQDHLDDVVNLCRSCHQLMHPHAVAVQRDALRPECPECGSREARRVVVGFPSFADRGEEDVVHAGCVVDYPFHAQWRCGSCGEGFLTLTTAQLRAALGEVHPHEMEHDTDTIIGDAESPPLAGRLQRRGRPLPRPRPRRSGPLGGEMRLASESGAALTLSAVLEPNPGVPGALSLTYDIGIVSPDRDVRYLRRPTGPGFVDSLAETLWSAAAEVHPELSVADFSDDRAGFAFAMVGSDAETVTVEVTVLAELDADVPDHDGINFEVRRADLIAAAHRLRALHEQPEEGESDGLPR